MPTESSYTNEQNDRMRQVVESLVERFGTQRQVAKALGISQPAVGAFIKGRYGVGPRVAEKIADLAGMSMDQLLGKKSHLAVVSKDEFPNRQPVVDFARRAGYEENVIRKLRDARPRGSEDVPSTEWTRLLHLLSELHAAPFVLEAAEAKVRKAR